MPRNGPAQLGFEGNPRRRFTSWLDGFAKLHSFKFSGSQVPSRSSCPLQPGLQVLYSGKMLESPNYVASREQGELVPSMTLNKFETKEEEWSWTERMTILAKSVLLTAFDNMNPALWRYAFHALQYTTLLFV